MTSAARGFAAATALNNQVISHLSPQALGPMKAQQVRQRSMPPDPASHAAPDWHSGACCSSLSSLDCGIRFWSLHSSDSRHHPRRHQPRRRVLEVEGHPCGGPDRHVQGRAANGPRGGRRPARESRCCRLRLRGCQGLEICREWLRISIHNETYSRGSGSDMDAVTC